MRNIKLVIEREYKERVAKKSFIWTTILTPLIMVGGIALVVGMMIWNDENRSDHVLVVDNSGVVMPQLESSQQLVLEPVSSDVSLDSALRRTDVDGILVIPGGIVDAKKGMLRYYSNGPTSMGIESNLRSQVNNAVEHTRLARYDIPDIDQIMESVASDVGLQTYRNDREAEETASSVISYGIGYALTFVLYMFILLYGQMIMQSIIEEKNNRVMEVMVSSVRPRDLMMGKIIGTGLVAVTQVVIWIALLWLFIGLLLPAIMPASIVQELAEYQSSTSQVGSGSEAEILSGLSRLTNIGYMTKIAGLMLAFLIGGFLLYAAIFAAVGASVDNAQDASQLAQLAVLPTVVGLMVGMMACADPNTTVAAVFSYIPFTAPMVMMARIPFSIPAWEICVSLAILYASFVVMVWIAAKIYRVGVFMYGKKPTIKDLARWVKEKA